jgi:hypothetical protein
MLYALLLSRLKLVIEAIQAASRVSTGANDRSKEYFYVNGHS